MRIHTALLIAALALGSALIAGASRPARAQETVTIAVGDLWFCNESFEGGVCETTISQGDTVVWDFNSASLPHTSTECGASCGAPSASPLWDSGTIEGGTFQFTFDDPGTYLYHCELHPTDMNGGIVVQEAAEEPTEEPQDGGAAPTATPGGGLPVVGQRPDSGSSMAWIIGTLLAGAIGLGGIGAGAYAAARRRR